MSASEESGSASAWTSSAVRPSAVRTTTERRPIRANPRTWARRAVSTMTGSPALIREFAQTRRSLLPPPARQRRYHRRRRQRRVVRGEDRPERARPRGGFGSGIAERELPVSMKRKMLGAWCPQLTGGRPLDQGNSASRAVPARAFLLYIGGPIALVVWRWSTRSGRRTW